MSVYKLTCSETGKVYYGSTKNTLKVRKSKGWYTCSCKDFVNPNIELVETVDDLNNLLEREDYYIRNFECVNKNGATFNSKQYDKEWRANNKERKAIMDKKSKKKIRDEKRYHCSLCNLSFTGSMKLQRHLNGYRCKLKHKSYAIHGEKWKEHYLNDNKNRYNENRRKKDQHREYYLKNRDKILAKQREYRLKKQQNSK